MGHHSNTRNILGQNIGNSWYVPYSLGAQGFQDPRRQFSHLARLFFLRSGIESVVPSSALLKIVRSFILLAADLSSPYPGRRRTQGRKPLRSEPFS